MSTILTVRRGRAVIVVVLIAAMLAACGGQKQTATIRISGAWALYPLAVSWAGEYNKTHPAIRVDVSAGGAGKGMTDALTGLADLGMVSRAIAPRRQRGAV